MTKSVSRAARKRSVSDEAGALLQSWQDLGIQPAEVEHFPPLANAADIRSAADRRAPRRRRDRIADRGLAGRQRAARRAVPAADAPGRRAAAVRSDPLGGGQSASGQRRARDRGGDRARRRGAVVGPRLHAARGGRGGRSAVRSSIGRSRSIRASARAWLGLALVANQLSDKNRAEAAFTAALDARSASSPKPPSASACCASSSGATPRPCAIGARRSRPAAKTLSSTPGSDRRCSSPATSPAPPRTGETDRRRASRDQKLIQRFALARFLETVIAGDIEAAFAAYREAAGPNAEDSQSVARTAFSILSALRSSRRGDAPRPRRGCRTRTTIRSSAISSTRSWAKSSIGRRATISSPISTVSPSTSTSNSSTCSATTCPRSSPNSSPRPASDLPRAVDLGCGTGLAGPAFATRTIAARRRRPVAAHARQGDESGKPTMSSSKPT